MKFSETFSVPGTPDDVLAYAADFRNLPAWDPSIDQVSLRDGEAQTPGARFEVALRFFGVPSQLEYTLQEFVPGERAVLKAGNLFCTAVDTVEVEADPKGTRITWTAEIDFAFPVQLVDPLLAWAFRGTVDAAVAGLRRALELKRAA